MCLHHHRSSLSLVIKLKSILSNTALLQICVCATAVSLVPGSYLLARRPSATNLLYASVCAGLSFFLWSFQVRSTAADAAMCC